MIMPNAARLTLPKDLSKKKNGTPISAAAPKQTSCRFVRLKNTLDLPSSGHEGREYMLPNKNLLSVSVH